VLAVLNLYDKQDGVFTDADLRTIVSLCDQAGVAIENVLLHQEAQRMAIMDGLTGIWNHRWFQIQFAQELDRAERFRRPFSLIVLDIDDFKTFNDTYGHQVGDFVLVELARRVKSTIRDVDMFARYGGEEFELLLSETDLSGGLNAAEKIREAIGGSPFTSDMLPKPLTVTVSVGVASYPEAGLDAPTIFKAADLAMYEAKSKGKNRVAGHCPTG
jgi:two-component system cell cycle response regulator